MMLLGLAVVGMAACSPGEAITPPPTLTLIPATLTFTPPPAPPTPTREALPGPDDVATAASDALTPDETPELDPVAGELVRLAMRRLGDELDLPTRRMRVVEVRPIQWTDTSLGCPQVGQNYTPLLIDGYRIVVAAGDGEYIFHSDFDRVLPCDPDDEQLPEAE